MLKNFDDFMVFELKDSGERIRLNITETEFRKSRGKNVFYPKQVVIIVKNKLRKMFIWKGVESSVRKKFIASRVAIELQSELIATLNYHRCKIVSVDQGEESEEFLEVFGFDEKKLPKPKKIKQSEGLVEDYRIIEQKVVNIEDIQPSQPKLNKVTQDNTQNQKIEIPKTSLSRRKTYYGLKNEKQSKKLLEEIIKIPIPKNFKRKNILVGDNILYGEIIKKLEIFGKKIEEREWEPVSNLPKETFELEGHKLRIHFNNEIGKLQAIEILENELLLEDKKEIIEEKEFIDYNKWTVKQLKSYCSKHKIKVPSSYRKADIVKLVQEFNQQ